MMNKSKKLIIYLSVALSSLLAEENTIMEEQQLQNLQNEKSLEHLFNNSKFPVDDYIYKAGKREANEENTNLNEVLKKLEELEKKQKEAEKDGKKIDPNTKQDDKENADRLKEKEEELKAKQEALQREMQEDNRKAQIQRQKSHEAKIKELIRAQILANRNNEIKEINANNSKFGVDGFSNQKSIDISTNEHKLYRTIRAGRMIPAILTSAISSDLSGIVTAQIEQDIYATMGNAVLIPRGSKAIGFYTNDTKLGRDRLEIRWREIITPQGINIMLTDAIVADNMGMTGAIGAINNKYWERYGIPFSISTISNALLLAIASKVEKGSNTYIQEYYNDAQADVSSVVQDMIQQQSQIKPTIEIRSGSRIFLVPTNHMWFAKPKNGEVLMRYFED